MSQVRKDAVVQLSYVLRDGKGEILDEAGADDGFLYLHGHQNIVPGLENALDGATVGKKVSVALTPDQGYGDYDPALVRRIEKKQFPAKLRNPEIGEMFQIEEDDAVRVWSVSKVEPGHITIDGNHELAGKDLHFEVEVLAIRDASAEEIEHGHAHTPGHHHH